MRGEASQVTVKQEAGLGVESVRDGEEVERVAILGDEFQRLFLTVDLHLANFGVRHSKRLSQMFHRLFTLEFDRDRLLPLITL